MKYEWRIPFFLVGRWIRRGNKWTLGLIIFLMAIAFVNLIFVAALFNGIIISSNDQIIKTYTGNIFATPKEGSDYIDSANTVIQQIQTVTGIKAISAQMSVPASLEYQNKKGNWPILAINPSNEQSATIVAAKITAGQYLQDNDLNQIIIGSNIAGKKDDQNAFSLKGAVVGEKITLSFDGVSRDFTIKGIFHSKSEYADQRAFITQQALHELIPALDNKATSIVITIDKKGNERKIIDQLIAKNIQANFYSWEEASGLMASVADSFLSINVILSFVGILIAAITIFIVIYIDLVNKKQQIGILRAIGIRPYIIRAAYVIQSAIYSVSGVIFGTGIFYGILVPYFNAHPFSLPIGDASLIVNAADFTFRAEAIMWVAVLAGLIPAFIITRARILDAIKGK